MYSVFGGSRIPWKRDLSTWKSLWRESRCCSGSAEPRMNEWLRSNSQRVELLLFNPWEKNNISKWNFCENVCLKCLWQPWGEIEHGPRAASVRPNRYVTELSFSVADFQRIFFARSERGKASLNSDRDRRLIMLFISSSIIWLLKIHNYTLKDLRPCVSIKFGFSFYFEYPQNSQ